MTRHEVELLVSVEVELDPYARGTHDGVTLEERAVEYGYPSAAVAAAIARVDGIFLAGSDGWADFDRDAVRAWIVSAEER